MIKKNVHKIPNFKNALPFKFPLKRVPSNATELNSKTEH